MPGKLVYNIVLLSGLFLLPVFGNAQEVLLDVDFNDCELPADWAVDLQGNPDAAWYVGTPVNGNSDGSSIDGSCMLIIDDDATGEDTDPFDLTLWSPAFDGSGFTNLALQLDVHFRNYNGSDSLEILVRSGEAVERIQLFRDQSTGLQFSEFTTVTADLAFYATDQMQIGIHYADGGDWNWWAGVDNILVTGSGDGDNILLADFNDCTLPTGWLTEVVTGENDWQLGFLDNENTGVTSMNGSCFLYFDDDGLGEEAAFSTVRLATPEIDGSAGSEMILNVDLTFRTFQENESLVIGVYDVETERFSPVATYLSDVGGPEMDNYETQSIDLSAFRAQRMRIVFQYDDGDSWGWWIGMDNIKLTVRGELNELCTKAQPLEIATDTCVQASTTLALFDGPQPLCSAANVGSLWYTFNATQSGWVTATTQADFNDVITVLAGDCTDPQPVSCANRDEHGFTGETHYFQVTAGNDYYLRVSGQTSSFGRARGNLCLNLAYSTGPPAGPTNEACSAALALTVDEACVAGNNYWAQFPDPLPSRAALVRAGVWYQFTPSTTTPLIIRTTADFAHALTLFDGSCDNLIEVATNEYGDELLFSEVSAGTTYYLQVTGAFATVEGNLCASVTTTETTPENATCPTALNLPLNGECVFATNAGASFNGPAISCDPYLDASIWFQTTAPASGNIQLLADADFQQTISVYAGTCDALEEVFCARNPLACDGYLTVSSLSPGDTYWVRVSSSATVAGFVETGNICLSARDGEGQTGSEPLALTVTYDCYGNGALLDLEVAGGDGNYVIEGHTEQDIIALGETYLVIVTDGRGCVQSASGTVSCAASEGCALTGTAVSTNPASCFNTADGGAMVSVTGGSGEYTYDWPGGQTGNKVNNLLPGEYVVSVTDGDGCSAGIPVTVEGPAPIFLDVLSVENVTEAALGSISFEVSGGAAPFAVSVLLDGVVLPNADPAALAAGIYEVVITDANGCTVNSGSITIEDLTNLGNLTENQHWITADPNPTAGPLRLSWELPEACEFSILDTQGRTLRHQSVAAEMYNYQLDLRALPAGMYLLRWQGLSAHWTQRVVVE